MSDKSKDKATMGTAPTNTDIDDIGQITSAVISHLRANPETQKRTENVVQVFLGGALAALDPEQKPEFAEEDENAPPEAIGLADYLEKQKKTLLAEGYTPEQAEMILMSQLGALSVYTAIANNEKKISIVRRVMAHHVRKSKQKTEKELEQSKPITTAMGKSGVPSHREQARLAMRGKGHRTR